MLDLPLAHRALHRRRPPQRRRARGAAPAKLRVVVRCAAHGHRCHLLLLLHGRSRRFEGGTPLVRHNASAVEVHCDREAHVAARELEQVRQVCRWRIRYHSEQRLEIRRDRRLRQGRHLRRSHRRLSSDRPIAQRLGRARRRRNVRHRSRRRGCGGCRSVAAGGRLPLRLLPGDATLPGAVVRLRLNTVRRLDLHGATVCRRRSELAAAQRAERRSTAAALGAPL
mmetsp:Transcript_13381/g.33362  ORF Transcript_13381/g.33362 Transcript_13381/m.33362 type:complete len:225 (+) Transcript_13381:3-677(+)